MPLSNVNQDVSFEVWRCALAALASPGLAGVVSALGGQDRGN